jgi:hypothetical protein
MEINKDSCVYYYLKDNNKPKKKKIINKIVTLDFFVKNELTNIEKIKSINDYKKYYYFCENSSELLLTEIDENQNYFNTRVDNEILLKFLDTELIYLKNYLKSSLSRPKIYILKLIYNFQQLLKSINMLLEKGIVHNFINLETILFGQNDLPMLTNFAYSLDVSRQLDLKPFFLEYDPTYIEWPPEFHILSFFLTNKLNSLSSSNIENIINTVVDNHIILKTFGENFVKSYKGEAIDYFKKYINLSYDEILKDVLKFYKTWDNYALSILYLRLLIDLNRKMSVKKNKFIILFMKLLVCNINLNPLKRLTIDTTLISFESILDGLEIKDYKEVIDNLVSSSTFTSSSSSSS